MDRKPDTEQRKPRENSGYVSTLGSLVRAMRPQQWIKNLFVIAPLVFAKHLTDPGQVVRASAAFVLFCLISGVVYIINDLADREVDRLHPTKRNRPIASGGLGLATARWSAALIALLAIGAGFTLGYLFVAFLAGYLVLFLFYSFLLKRWPYLDVFAIAAGFLLRVMAGAAALKVDASVWLVVCTGLLAVFLGLGKRAHELAAHGEKAANHRPVLGRYRLSHVKIAMVALGLSTIAGYVFYTLSPHTLSFFGTERLVWTSGFPLAGLTRFAQLVFVRHRAESPTDEMLRDPIFLTNLVLYSASVVVIIYLFPS